MQTPYSTASHGDHAAAFPAFSEQDESCSSDPNGGLSMMSSHRDPLQSTDPWAGQSTAAAPGPPPVSVLRGMWERWRPSATSTSNRVPRSYGPARTPQRAHSAPAEARASPSVQWHTPAEIETMLRNAPINTPPAATPAWSTWSSEHQAVREPASLGEAVTLPPVGGGTTPVEPGGWRRPSPCLTSSERSMVVRMDPQDQASLRHCSRNRCSMSVRRPTSVTHQNNDAELLA